MAMGMMGPAAATQISKSGDTAGLLSFDLSDSVNPSLTELVCLFEFIVDPFCNCLFRLRRAVTRARPQAKKFD